MNRPLVQLVRLTGPVAALVLAGALVLLLGFLLVRGGGELGLSLLFGSVPPLEAIFGGRPVWDGLWPAYLGTCKLVLLTTALALFPGVGCGIYLAELASPRQRRVLDFAVDLLAGMPSIVMGLFGFTLILFLRRTFLPDANTCLLLAAGCLALLVLPVLVAATREALQTVPKDLRVAAAALGLSRLQTLTHLGLPLAARGIVSGIVLATGRAAEDTAVIMLTGVVANAGLSAGLGDKFEALPFHIFYLSSQYQDQDELARAFGAACLLLGASCVLLLAARALERSFRRRWQGGQSL